MATDATSRADAALDTLWAVAAGAAPPQGADTPRVADALRALTDAVAVSSRAAAYAKQRGAVTQLCRWLAADDDLLVELAAAAVAALAAPDTRLTRTYRFGAHAVTLRDASAVTGGLGWRVWRAALILCDMLAERPSLVAGARVLEVGAGCGACGLLAAQLGAQRTVLTDCLPGLLDALAANVTLNQTHDASVCVRHLDWSDDAAEDASPSPAHERLPHDEAFDVVIGSDVMYEHEHAAALPSVLARHLASCGFALLVCGVRFPDVLHAFRARLSAVGLHCDASQLRRRRDGATQEQHTDSDEDESVTMVEPPLGQLGMLVWREGGPPPQAAVPPPWVPSWCAAADEQPAASPPMLNART